MTGPGAYDDWYWRRRAARRRVMLRRTVRGVLAASNWRGLFITVGTCLTLGGALLA